MSKAYARNWSIVWFVLASPVLVTALVVWSWVGVVSMTAVALLLSSIICGSKPNDSTDLRVTFARVPQQLLLAPALRWAVIAVAVVLTTVFSPWLGVLMLAAVIGSSPWAVCRMAGSRSPGDDLSMEHIRELVRQLDLPGLCWAWRTSHDLLTRVHDVEARGRVVTLRQAYLDEMEHRDATGFRTWLAVARATEDPEGYLSDKGGNGAAAA